MIHGTKAVIRSYQGFADDESLLSVHSVEHQGGRAFLTLSVPDEILPSIRNFLESGFSLVHWVETQNRVKKAIVKAHDPVVIQEREEAYRKHSENVLSKYDLFVSSGLSSREAIRKTKEFFKGNLTCHMIELMARKAGRFPRRCKK